MERARTALVLGGGGMFGAYQAGVWSVLQPHWQPDLIVGASIGAVNGYVFASQIQPGEWLDHWLDFRDAATPEWRMPRSLLGGCVDRQRYEAFFQTLSQRYQPKTPFALVMTELPRLRRRVVPSPEVTWRHLAASCAVPLVLPQVQIDGGWYTDGGLTNSLPVDAALELGATHIIAVSILPREASPGLALIRNTLHRLAPQPGETAKPVEMLLLEPSTPLGPLQQAAVWRKELAEAWIATGQKDARQLLPRILDWPVRNVAA
jgi:NTE family protein